MRWVRKNADAKTAKKIDDAIEVVSNGAYKPCSLRSDFYDASGNPTKWRNPVTNQIEDIPTGVNFHNDHIFPKNEFTNLKGFNELNDAQKKALLDDPINLQSLNGSMNCSKDCKIETDTTGWIISRGELVNAEYRKCLKFKQDKLTDYFQKKIAQMGKGN